MAPSLTEEDFKRFRRLIKKHAGIAFSRQKYSTLQRKLASRLNRLGMESYREYYRYLVHNKEGGIELRQLINTITVEQTAFFRHKRQFELLTDIILPQIATQNERVRKLRIWSAGCATGQEAYSICMVVNEIFRGNDTWDIKILGSDIATDALKIAYRGLYSEASIRQVPSEYVKKYFEEGTGEEAGFYRVRDSLRNNVLFRRLNFIDSEFPFRSPVNIIFCRNVMIYFDHALKRRLVDSFFDVLEVDGFLCLGSSESLLGIDDRFSLVGHSTYQKTG